MQRVKSDIRLEISEDLPDASIYVDLADPTFLDFGYVRRIGDVIDVAWPEAIPIAAVHLGGAGATLPRYIRATRPRSRQAVFEISADVLTISREHLGLRSGNGLRVHQQDARVTRQRPSQPHPLPLPATQLPRITIRK